MRPRVAIGWALFTVPVVLTAVAGWVTVAQFGPAAMAHLIIPAVQMSAPLAAWYWHRRSPASARLSLVAAATGLAALASPVGFMFVLVLPVLVGEALAVIRARRTAAATDAATTRPHAEEGANP